jgi:hypothetical protein
MIYQIITVIVLQFMFIFFRTLNVIYTAHNNLLGAMVTGLMVNILWIVTTYYGIEAFENGNVALAIAYLAGGQIGIYWGMRKKEINNFLISVYNHVFNKNQH